MSRRRRGAGEGCISQRKDGRWVGVLDLGWQDGKRRRKSVYGKTRAEAARKLAEAQNQQQAGMLVEDERMTVEQFIDTWLKAVKDSVKHSTWRRYDSLLRVHAKPTIGKLRLARLKPLHLKQMYAARLEAGLAPSTVRQLHVVVHRALRDAERWALVPRNVAGLVSAPRRVRREFQVFSPEQARVFLQVVKGDRLEALYAVAITTGMREGELFGLCWEDVNLDAGTLHLARRVKTESSRRQVLLPRLAVEALKAHKTQQARERLRVGERWRDNGLVFPNRVGEANDPSHFLRRDYRPLLERAGLPRIRFHDLRHSAATLLLGMGVHPKIVSELLGHSNISITLDLYSHVTMTMQQQAASAIDGLLGSQPGSQSEPDDDETPGQADAIAQ
jgi:integrase